MPIAGPPLAEPISTADILAMGLRSDPHGLALTSVKGKFTWQEVDDQSSQLASGYLDLGLSAGDRVASLLPNRPVVVIHYLACLKAGLVATPLNYRYTPVEIDHALEVSGASLLLHHSERDADIAASKRAVKLSKGTIRCEAGNDRGVQFQDLLQEQPKSGFPRAAPDAPAFLFFTSGSTELPKGVTHTHRTLGWMLASVVESFHFCPQDVLLPGSSFAHMAASLFSLSILAAGGQLVVPWGNHSDELLPLIRSTRPTVMFMLPSALIGLVRDYGAQHEDFSSLRLCFAGGDKVSAELESEFTELTGCVIDEGYGMTETGHATISPTDGEIRLGSIGIPCPGYEFSIRDEDGNELSTGQSGRAWVRFMGNSVGYWNHPEATARAFDGEWLDTGDVMAADSDGYLWFRGREKQIIVHDGSNICPQEVEEVIGLHPAVEAVCVVGVHDSIHGENVRAYITLRDSIAPRNAADLIRFARKKVGYKAPDQIVFLDRMPLNAAGKLDRTKLIQLAEQRLETPPG